MTLTLKYKRFIQPHHNCSPMKALLTIVWFTASTLLVWADHTITLKVEPVDNREVADSQQDVSIPRFLRVSEPLNEREDERMLPRVKMAKESAWWVGKRLKSVFLQMQLLLTLDVDAHSALRSEELPELLKSYQTPEEQIEFVEYLMQSFGVKGLTKAIVDVQNIGTQFNSNEFATTVSQLEMESFLRKKYTPADVLNMLEIPHDSYILSDPIMVQVEKYVTLFNDRYSRTETLFSAMEGSVDEHVLIESIARVKTSSTYKERGERVENALIATWGREQLHPVDLLKRLEINQDLTSLSNPILASLETVRLYIRRYNDVESNDKVFLIRWFTNRNEDYRVLKALHMARQHLATNEIAKTLQNELLEMWVIDKKSIDNVVDILKLKDEGYSVYASWKLEILEGYIQLFNENKPREKDALDVLTVLQNHVDDGPLAILLFKKMGFESIPQERYAQHLSDLFQRWEDAYINPVSIKTKYFENVDEDLADDVEHIVSQYREFYAWFESELEMNGIDPRRS